jgi:hypothetical protein
MGGRYPYVWIDYYFKGEKHFYRKDAKDAKKVNVKIFKGKGKKQKIRTLV